MRSFEYVRAATVEDALAALRDAEAGETDGQHDGQSPRVRPLAGGTDLLTLMKGDIVAPRRLIDVKRIADLSREVVATDDGLTIGALVTLADVEQHPVIRRDYAVLSDAASVAATPQLRNVATVGGNLLQRSRCWYFRNSRIHCWLKGGADCPAHEGENHLHAIFDNGPCWSAHPSDFAPALLALDATVTLRGPEGERTLPLDQFFAPPVEDRRTETVARPDELIVSITVPRPTAGTRSTYEKAMDRKAWAFALVSVAAAVRVDGSSIAAARLVLGGVASVPRRAVSAENAIVGEPLGETTFDRAADIALSAATPLRHNRYKVPLARALIRRALASAAGVASPT